MGWRDQRPYDLPSLTENRIYAKKKTYGYEERDEVARQAFVSQLASKKPESLVYADEAGMDSRDDYAYAWSEKGKRFQALKSGRRQGRINLIAAPIVIISC